MTVDVDEALAVEVGANVVQTGGRRVAFEQAGKIFATPGGTVKALDGVDFAVEPSEIFGIIGRSGAGKSTLIRTVNGLERLSSGRVTVGDVDVGALGIGDLTRLRGGIGMIFQHFNLLWSKTVEQNVGLPLRLAGVSRQETRRRVEELLALVGLSEKRHEYPRNLSGGQKQRVGIARALARSPDVLLCDEATSALDPETTRSILQLLRDINRRLRLTVILITHEMEVIRQICDRVAVIEQGRIVETGPVWRIFGDPTQEATKALLKPHADELSDDLARRVSPLPSNEATVPIFAVTYTGQEEREPDLGGVIRILGEGTRLLHGGLERIQGHAQGRLILANPALGVSDAEGLLAALSSLPPRSELVGYVTGTL